MTIDVDGSLPSLAARPRAAARARTRYIEVARVVD
jgi:hypothetical protein